MLLNGRTLHSKVNKICLKIKVNRSTHSTHIFPDSTPHANCSHVTVSLLSETNPTDSARDPNPLRQQFLTHTVRRPFASDVLLITAAPLPPLFARRLFSTTGLILPASQIKFNQKAFLNRYFRNLPMHARLCQRYR